MWPVADERAAFLADTCLGDENLRRAVEQLVSADESAGDFLEVPAAVRLIADDNRESCARRWPGRIQSRGC